MTNSYRWYSVGHHPRSDRSKVEILGWSRDRARAMAREGTIEAYWASSRRSAAVKAKADRGFEIEWRKS
jgi:hypothetical protein